MKETEMLRAGKYYHIYNCGINGANLFYSQQDYQRFIKLVEKYILPVCDIYAWVLMKNHFHILVRIKGNLLYKYSNDNEKMDKEKFNELKWETVEYPSFQMLTGPPAADAFRFDWPFNLSASDAGGPDSVKKKTAIKSKKSPRAHLHFSHFFNAYAKYFNAKYNRHGSLFERQFKRKEIDDKRYFKAVVIYIHQNPVHHGFCEHPLEYGWSSYLTIISIRPTRLHREEVFGWFDGHANFKQYHDKRIEIEAIEKYLEL